MKKTQKIFASVNFPAIVAKAKEDIRVRSFTCKDTGISVISNYSVAPFSPITGGRMVPAGNKVLKMTVAEVNALEEMGKCPHCGAVLASHKDLANALLGSKIHCIVCGEELEVGEEEVEAPADVALEDNAPEEVVEAETPAEYIDKIRDNFEQTKDKIADQGEDTTTQEVEADADDALIDEVLDEAEDNIDEMEDNIVEENPGAETTTMASDEFGEAPAEEVAPENVEEAEGEDAEEAVELDPAEAPEAENVEEAEGEEALAEETQEEVAPEDQAPVEDEEIRVDMLARVQAGLNTKKIELISSGKGTFDYMMVSNRPVATLHKDRASAEIKDIFANKGLLTQALVASIEKEGLSKAVLSAFGIVPMVLKVKANEAIEKAVDEQVKNATTQMEVEKEELEASLQQSLGIAAVGINRNVFTDVKNVLAEDLIDNLEQIGVEDARDIVESSFQRCGEEYLRTIVAKAEEFKGKSAEVRNEIAATVAGAAFQTKGLNLEHKAVASVRTPVMQENEGEVARLRNLFFGK